MSASPVRTLVVAVPDWSVIAAGVRADAPAATFAANRVRATTPAARIDGVETGQRRREAQRRCPSLTVLGVDHDRDAREFGPFVGLLDRFTPRLELSRPGRIAFPTIGPSRYFGGDDELAAMVLDVLDARLLASGWAGAVGVGVADGMFAAERAAVRAVGRAPCVVPPGGSGAFLAPFPVRTLGVDDLVDVLLRLGLRTLGAFAALDPGDVVSRFGAIGRDAHRLARGDDVEVPDLVGVPPDLAVTTELDPPAERVDVVAFAARTSADELQARLSADGLGCARVSIAMESEHGERIERVWRADDAMGAAAIADRVRWQVDGWLHGPIGSRPSGGVVRLALVPEEVRAARGRQPGFWGGEGEADERAGRALARVQGLLGGAAVTVPEVRGGRGPAERVVRVPFTGVDVARRTEHRTAQAPWPGRVPDPAPALVPITPVELEVLDGHGRAVTVSGRGALGAIPMRVVLASEGGPSSATVLEVRSWAGPWLADERWWDPDTHRRRARLQLVLSDGRALLVAIEGGRWSIEAVYD